MEKYNDQKTDKKNNPHPGTEDITPETAGAPDQSGAPETGSKPSPYAAPGMSLRERMSQSTYMVPEDEEPENTDEAPTDEFADDFDTDLEDDNVFQMEPDPKDKERNPFNPNSFVKIFDRTLQTAGKPLYRMSYFSREEWAKVRKLSRLDYTQMDDPEEKELMDRYNDYLDDCKDIPLRNDEKKDLKEATEDLFRHLQKSTPGPVAAFIICIVMIFITRAFPMIKNKLA